MTKGILCTIDFTQASKEALAWAVQLAHELHSSLTILYTYRLTRNINGEAAVWKKKLEEEAQQKFAVLEKEVLAGKDVAYEFKVEVGFVADRVEEYARKNSISFLVMDKNMSTKSRETFDEIVEQMRVPLVIVP